MKKKILAALLCMAMVVSVCACSNDGNNTGTETGKKQVDPPTVTTLATLDDLNAILVDDYEITDELVKDGITELLFGAGGGLIEVTDRDVVQEGDIVLTGFAGTPNDELAATLTEDELEKMQGNMSTSEGAAQLIDVSNNGSIDESTGEVAGYYIEGDWGTFSEGLVGAKIGEGKSHEVVFPDPYQADTRLSGQKAIFVFTVEKIYTKVDVDTVTDEYIAQYLEKDYEIKNKAEAEDYVHKVLAYGAITEYIVAESVVDIPENYLDARADAYMTHMDTLYTKRYGVTLESFLSTYYGQTLAEAKTEVMEWLKASVIPAEAVYKEYVVSKNLTLNEEEHEEFVNEFLVNYDEYYASADDIYVECGCGDAEAGKAYLLNKDAFDEYFEELYSASIAVTE